MFTCFLCMTSPVGHFRILRLKFAPRKAGVIKIAKEDSVCFSLGGRIACRFKERHFIIRFFFSKISEAKIRHGFSHVFVWRVEIFRSWKKVKMQNHRTFRGFFSDEDRSATLYYIWVTWKALTLLLDDYNIIWNRWNCCFEKYLSSRCTNFGSFIWDYM